MSRPATQSYQQCERPLGALYTQADKNATQDQMQLVAASSRNAHLLFRKLSEPDLVVPPQGSHAVSNQKTY